MDRGSLSPGGLSVVVAHRSSAPGPSNRQARPTVFNVQGAGQPACDEVGDHGAGLVVEVDLVGEHGQAIARGDVVP